jgi:hypothetical protein
MTDEEAVISEAEAAVREAVQRMSAEQSREQMASVPFLRQMARTIISQRDASADDDSYIFVIQSDPDKDINGPEVSNPLGLDTNSATNIASELRLLGSFSNAKEAVALMTNPIASICLHEAHKLSPNALFAYFPKGLSIIYAGGKVTFSRHIAGDEYITNHTSIAEDDNPEAFFAKCEATEAEQEFVGALIALKESAGLLERQTPSAYKVAVDRLRKASGADDEGDSDDGD